METVPLLAWALLAGFGITMVVIDLYVAGTPGRQMTFRNAIAWNVVWFAAGLGFAIPVWLWLGGERGGEYVAGYLIERSLSLDNVFVFALIFAAFAVPPRIRQTALMWGILGAIVLRVVMIFLGIGLLEAAHWLIYVFGAFLVYTGAKMAVAKHDEEVDLEHNRTLKLVRRAMPLSDDYHDTRLTTRLPDGRRAATPLVAVLAVIATTDLIFALDSIPAIFAITLDPFVVVAANVLALAGMRSLYFLLEGMLGEFRFLQPALSLLLVIIGIKLVLSDVYHLPTWASLALVVGIVGGGIVASILSPAPPRGVEEIAEDHARHPELRVTEPDEGESDVTPPQHVRAE